MSAAGISRTIGRAMIAPARVIASPVTTFSSAQRVPPFWILFSVVLLTTLAAYIPHPVTEHILRTTPAIGASPNVARSYVLVEAFVMTPIGTAVFLSLMAWVTWSAVWLSGGQVRMITCCTILYLAGSVGILKRIFVAVVLYGRWWFEPAVLNGEIATGVDAFLPADATSTLPLLVLKHAGVFEIWFILLVALGLKHFARVERPRAVAVAVALGMILIGSKTAIASLAV